MKSKNSMEILLDPLDYWERKLNLNFETEFIRYKKLCGKLSKKEMHKLAEIYYITYTNWEKYMIGTIKHLDRSELYEYIHFLRNCSRRSDMVINIDYTLVLPLAISLFCPFLLNFLMEITNVSVIPAIITSIIRCSVLRELLKRLLLSLKMTLCIALFMMIWQKLRKNNYKK